MAKNNKDEKQDKSSLLRVPKAKKKFGLKVPEIKMPHLELVHPEINESEKNISLPRQTTQTRQTSVPRQTTQIKNARQTPTEISPTKDFQKIPNSITRNAIPEGFFKAGKSKQLYDVLYSLTRGAINPKKSVRASKAELMKKAGIGSRITFDNIINNFEEVGLIKITIFPGQHQGNLFEIFTYEESLTRQTRQTTHTSQTSHAQKLDRLLTLETSQSSQSLNVDNKEDDSIPNTSLKTVNTNDDEEKDTFKDFIKTIAEATVRITGKKLNKKEGKKWNEVAELLVTELELAAARTETVSSVPAFLKEVLRRKLETKPAQTKNKSAKVSTQMQVGKPSPETPSEPLEWEREVLTTEEREKTLSVMRERKAEGYLDLVKSMEQTYTAEDWTWLMEELEK